MDDFRGLYMAVWTAPGRCCTYRAFIIAEDNYEADYFWRSHLKEDEGDNRTWREGKRNCCTSAEIRGGDAREEFRKLYPKWRSKKGVYRCEPLYHSQASDHLWD